ncbi:hypothetical protein DVH24_025811, partial [Malus domestica]
HISHHLYSDTWCTTRVPVILKNLSSSLVILAVIASDPDIISDFIVPPDYNGTVDGKFFTFTGFHGIFDQAPQTVKASKTSIVEFPALNGQIHTRPDATGLLFLLDGTLEVRLIDTKNNLYTQKLQTGDLFVFPEGLVHYQYNSDLSCQPPPLQHSEVQVLEQLQSCRLYLARELTSISSEGSGDDRKVGAGANSFVSKSLRMSKRRGVALLKNSIRGVGTAVSVLTGEKERENTMSPLTPPPEQKPAKNSSSSSSASSEQGNITRSYPHCIRIKRFKLMRGQAKKAGFSKLGFAAFSLKASVVEFPFLNDLSVSNATLHLPPNSLFPPHTHPGASGFMFLMVPWN